jgi:DNA-binding IclR family transcriptional regulator
MICSNVDRAKTTSASARLRVPLATQSVPALHKTISILEMLASSRAGLSLPEIVKKSGFPKSSIHCILVTLQRENYLYRNEATGRYMFGMKLFSLANMALSGLQLREQAAPFLYALMQQTKLTTHMAILEQSEAVLIMKIDAPGVCRLATWIGKRMEVHCTGLGKALIANLPEQRLNDLLKDRGLPRHNENTIASVKRLKDDLAQAVKRGYAIDDEEDEIGLRCIGVPVFDHTDSVSAAISIAGTTSQITGENVNDLAQKVKEGAASISHILGSQAAGAALSSTIGA